jgi:hypothetical protein
MRVVPAITEVESVEKSDHELELVRLNSDLNVKAHAAANRAEGIATAANQTVASTVLEVGARMGALESARDEHDTTIESINKRLGTIETAVKRSPYQQLLYALTAVAVLLFYASELIDKYFPGGR